MADKNAQFALKGALSRHQSLGIRPITFEINVHPGRDGGARTSGPGMLILERRQFDHGLLILDFEGSGSALPNARALEAELDERLGALWPGAAKSIVIEPELDAWMWGASNAVEPAIDWPAGPGVRHWLLEKGFLFDANEKPLRPKEAMEAAMRFARAPRSSARYQHIAEKISLKHCKDAAFLRLRVQLQAWFPK